MTLYHTFCTQLRRASRVWHINPGTPLSTPITKRLQRQPAADSSTNVVNTTPCAARVKAGNQSTTAATSLWPDAFEPRMPKLTRQPSPPRPPRHRSPPTVRADRHHHSGQFASKRSTLSLFNTAFKWKTKPHGPLTHTIALATGSRMHPPSLASLQLIYHPGGGHARHPPLTTMMLVPRPRPLDKGRQEPLPAARRHHCHAHGWRQV